MTNNHVEKGRDFSASSLSSLYVSSSLSYANTEMPNYDAEKCRDGYIVVRRIRSMAVACDE